MGIFSELSAGHENAITHETTEVVATSSKPVQDQICQTPSKEVGRVHEAPSIAGELLAIGSYWGARASFLLGCVPREVTHAQQMALHPCLQAEQSQRGKLGSKRDWGRGKELDEGRIAGVDSFKIHYIHAGISKTQKLT